MLKIEFSVDDGTYYRQSDVQTDGELFAEYGCLLIQMCKDMKRNVSDFSYGKFITAVSIMIAKNEELHYLLDSGKEEPIYESAQGCQSSPS